ncbi:DUF2147 domain-containing protein [Pseudoluteimonas lycopersici]|uniref:DUF2147 domain-containing protein n=1 Tax=Pseudoluteimonas lycopersici TaxID=1324796 RepID=A0A516V2E9_9GAMM|nr:DUF2147 domain-containing protein [Lysobacter lycopersici]QDQ72693.1 DUF2147 domain-containing protein [Lysobacter lycopersici]
MRKLLVATVLAVASFATSLAMAQSNPLIGKWKTLDDESGKPMTISEIYMAKNGKLAARITENLGLPETCTGCSGEYHNKPFVGIVTLWNLSPTSNGKWGNGNGYKPSEDRHFKVKSVELIDNGERVQVTGCVLFICKKAEWVRVH